MEQRPHLLTHLLERAANRDPDAAAVVDGATVLSYGELLARSAEVAGRLRDAGVGRGDRVALCLDKSADAVVALWGVLFAGAAYVPLDVSAPVIRLGYVAADCAVAAIVTSDARAELADGVAAAVPAGPALVRVGAVAGVVEGRRTSPPCVDADLAYVLYTSGSTGRPKGVMLSHRNALAFVLWAAAEFGVGPGDRLSSHAPFHFDLSVFDLYASAAAGAAVVLVPARASVFPRELATFVRESRITVWYSVPSILSALGTRGGLAPGDLPDLRTVLFAGEVFPTAFLRRLMAQLPGVRFVNLYGPTETNVCTWYDVTALDPEDDADIPIGRAVPNDELFVVGEDGAAVATGTPGELLVRGATVMRGYWGAADRTARSLVAHPFDAAATDRVYRTGDLVVDPGDGELRFLGRRDHQIKSRGYRIELGEIETALHAQEGVLECAVVPVPDELISNRIVAFVVARSGVDDRALAKGCAQALPPYMVPGDFVLVDDLPRTPNGKVDRRLLVERAASSAGNGAGAVGTVLGGASSGA